MHRELEITVAAEATDRLVEALEKIEGVITLSVRRGESVKPRGDVINATVLNTGADAVLQAAVEDGGPGPVSISTSTVDSLIDTERHVDVGSDVDEVAWEEAETAMRRHTRPTLNFFVTTAAGGVIAAAALTASSRVTEATALVAAAIVAPIFEPLARFSVGAVNRQRTTMVRALATGTAGYVSVIVGALLTMLVLRAAGHGYVHEFVNSPTVHEVEHPPTLNLILSAAGAITGVVMVGAGRFTQLAGPLVALQLLPAAASLGVALELGKGGVAASSLARLAIDIGMVVVAGLVVFGYKHSTVHHHRRTPIGS